jgi:hypothetical protein
VHHFLVRKRERTVNAFRRYTLATAAKRASDFSCRVAGEEQREQVRLVYSIVEEGDKVLLTRSSSTA